MVFLEGEKSFVFPLFQKCVNKSKCQQQQKIWNLVFGFWFLVFSFMYLVRFSISNG